MKRRRYKILNYASKLPTPSKGEEELINKSYKVTSIYLDTNLLDLRVN